MFPGWEDWVRWRTEGNERKRKWEWGNTRKKMEKEQTAFCEWQGQKERERDGAREAEGTFFPHRWEKMEVDGKRGAGWDARAGSQDELSRPVDRWQPERSREEKSFFPFPICLCLPRSLAVWPALSLPLGLIKQTVGSTRSGRGGIYHQRALICVTGAY